jgi:hypothetical protein
VPRRLIAIMSNTFSAVQETAVEAYQLVFAQLCVYWDTSPPASTTPLRPLRMPYELVMALRAASRGWRGCCQSRHRMDAVLRIQSSIKRWISRIRRRQGRLAGSMEEGDAKLPEPQFRKLKGGELLVKLLAYYSEHEADQAYSDRWRQRMNKDADRRLKLLEAKFERRLCTEFSPNPTRAKQAPLRLTSSSHLLAGSS